MHISSNVSTRMSLGENLNHEWPIRVYWEDTDAGGIVYHAKYLHYAERARTEMIRQCGIEQAKYYKQKALNFVVSRMEIDFKAVARLDDNLIVTTSVVTPFKKARLILQQDIYLEHKPIWQAKVTLALINALGKPQPMPANIMQALAEFSFNNK